jgi:hypothetical protein
MLKSLIAAFSSEPRGDLVAEGLYADQHHGSAREKISREYRARWQGPVATPDTQPWLFDPLQPPQGWRYDPYYECWIQTSN